VTSQIIGNNRVALFFQEEELAEHGLCSLSAECKEMKRFVVEALKGLGVPSDGNMEIEIFNGKEGMLVFAVVGIVPTIRYMVFDNLESFISATGVLKDTPVHSKLTYFDGMYWLEMRDFGDAAEKAALLLGEFGRRLEAEDFREGVLEEYGEVIEDDNVLGVFRNAFYGKKV